MRRGEVWWASLPPPRGSEPGYRRPVLIVQSDDFNQSSLNTVLVVALTTSLRVASAPGNVSLSPSVTGLPRRSAANVSQVITLGKSFLLERVSSMPRRQMLRVETGLRLILSL